MTSRPQLVHVMGWPSQQYGSFERFLVRLAEGASGAGLGCHLVFQGRPASERFVADVGAHAELHELGPARPPADPAYLTRLRTLLRAVGATHLHAHYGADAYHALAAAHATGLRRRFLTKHNMPATGGPTLSGLRHRWLAAQVEVVWATSRAVADALARLGVPEAKLDVAYLGVDPDAYRPDAELRERTRAELGVEPETRLVLSTSHLRPGKGVDLLPDLADELGRDPDGVLVALGGGGPLRDALTARARELGLGEDRFRLLGVREDVPALLAAADLFVFPTDLTEGMPLGLLEALASGTPVVATRVADNADLLGDAAVLVAPGDRAALVEACRALLGDPGGAADFGERGRRLVVERLSAQSAVERHVARYLASG